MRFSLNFSAKRSQSAMEYLMTYGWAILIIAVVLAALFSLGVFSSPNVSAVSSCVTQPGYGCTGLTLASNGLLSATIGSFAYLLTSVQTSCSINNTAPTTWSSSQGNINAAGSAPLTFACPIPSNAIGTQFKGSLWLQYVQGGRSIITRLGSVNAKVTSIGTAAASITYTSTGSGGSSSPNPITSTLASGAARYLCSATTDSGFSSSSWTEDDGQGSTYQSIGHQSGNTCSAAPAYPGSPYSIAEVGVTGATPTVQESGTGSNSGYMVTYTVGDAGQYTFMFFSESDPFTMSAPSVSPSSGTCTTAQNINSGTTYGYEYIYVCSGQSPGTYTVTITVSGGGPPVNPIYVVYVAG